MKTAELRVTPRPVGKKQDLKAVRNNGTVPAVVYGPGLKNSYCSFDERELRKAFGGHLTGNTLITLMSDSKDVAGKRVIVKTVDRDPATWNVVHVDFYEVQQNKEITLQVPLEFKGTPAGVRLGGGILQIVRRTVSIRALPDNIPEKVEVDISHLELNKNMHVSDIAAPGKFKIVDSGQYTICMVTEPEAEEVVAAPVAGAEGAAAEGAGAAAAAGTGAAPAGAGAAAAGKTGAAPAAKAAAPAAKPEKK